MDTFDCIKNRISVKKFKKKEVSKSVLFKILNAGLKAPSAGNSQNWRFVVLDDKDVINRVARATLQPEVFMNVNYAVVVCSDSSKVESEFPQQGKMYAIQNVAAAIENILLAATALGVDSNWIGAFADETIKDVLRIPSEIEVHAILPFGYRSEVPFKTRRIALAHATWFNKWKNNNTQGHVFPLSQHVKKIKKLVTRKK